MEETLSARRNSVVMSRIDGNAEILSASGMYRLTISSVTAMVKFSVSSMSSTKVGSGTIIIPTMPITSAASPMSL